MRVTEKGQVTIPKSVRRRLGIAAGAEVEFSIAGDAALLRKVAFMPQERNGEVRDLMDHVRRHRGSLDLQGMSVDEFYQSLRD